MRICLGGTFHPFHAGHRALLDAALARADAVFVGVTVGALARRERDMPDVDRRIETVRRHIEASGFRGEVTVRPLTDAVGPAASEDFDAIVVSPETVRGAERINETRRAGGLAPLEVITIPHVRADDLRPISATRIAHGDIDEDGRRLTPVRVAVGSQNPVKVAAVEAEFASILERPVEVRGFDVDSGVPEQPKEGQTMQGARARAREALRAWARADYAVGVEAGLNLDPDEHAWYDVQACVVVDGDGHATDGWGPAFRYPAWVTERALAGEMVSEILGPVAGDPRIGGTTGAIGFLTDGRMDRTKLTRQAVLMAMVPRLRAELYAGP